MTSLSPESRRARLLRVFERAGGGGERTKPFDAFAPEEQRLLSAQAQLAARELAIVACVLSDSRWVLVTTERVIWRANSSAQSASWAEISNASLDLTVSPDHSKRHLGKLGLSRLHLVLVGGLIIDLELEPGPSLVALWNVLKTTAVMR